MQNTNTFDFDHEQEALIRYGDKSALGREYKSNWLHRTSGRIVK